MRRADRLFHLVQLLRGRRSTTAAELAERLEVSERTIYRDVRDLVLSGVPIEGEAGVGYRLGRSFELPPLMFTVDEIEALVLGARMVETYGDRDLRQAARRALDKVEGVLPESARPRLRDTALFTVSFDVPETTAQHMSILRTAVHDQRVVLLRYVDQAGAGSQRRVRPLGLYFWGRTWTLGGWCELRQDHRNFRLDRITEAHLTDDVFDLEPPVTLEDYLRAVTAS